MSLADNTQYLICFLVALVLALVLTPIVRWFAVRWEILDRPNTKIKTHQQPVPYLGGLAVALSVGAALIAARFFTQFPTGTLRSLRGIFMGGSILLLLGLIDDIKTKGLGYRFKFLVQFTAAVAIGVFNMRIKFIQPHWFGDVLSVLWVVGIINAVNIIDIMDGLASGIGLIACLGFLFIALPSEEIYVNFIAAATAGSLLGFIPYNLSRRWKIFLGDTGSLLLGFILAALSMGTSYSKVNTLGVFAPILILGLPIYDTMLVTYFRLMRGMSPFLGSKDHFALRLEKFGFYREEILVICYSCALLLAFGAYQVTVSSTRTAVIIYVLTATAAVVAATWLARIRIDAA
jgi:UDP-GlcNAc:undecaprenyl-phosphate GlcNAc-1-phosphate transferase